jgi:hypothetical protein
VHPPDPAVFIDGSSRHLSYFDSLKEDAGYAATIERDPGDLLSSHAVKRFFGNFTQGRIWLLRKLLQEIFIWRLCLEKPEVVILDLDVMILDNDEALKREGVTPTYKKVKHLVNLIRKRYRADVPIIIRQDSGYFDQKLYGLYEELDIGYLSGGKLYKEIKEYVAQWPADQWATHRNDHQEWSYVEFGDRRKNWKRFRRVIYCRPAYEDRQRLLESARPDTLIYTNLGTGVAGKIVTHGGRVVLKVSGSVMKRLRFEELWQRCQSPPPIPRFA